MFLKGVDKETLEVLKMKESAIKQAVDVLEWLSQDPETIRSYEQRQKELRDEISRIEGAKEEGIKIGMEIGMGIGMEIGIEKVKKEEKIEIATKLLKLGISIKDVCQATGISQEEMKKLQQL